MLPNLTVGFELEVSGHAGNVLSGLRNAGLTEHASLHEYHCGCDDCEPSDEGPLFKAQQDCTADGEFITRILTYGSDEFERACHGIGAVLVGCGASVSGDVGNHVHVDQRGMNHDATRRLMRLFARYERELTEIAAAGHDSMRGYNGRGIEVDPTLWQHVADGSGHSGQSYIRGGHTLTWKRPTVEFRLWNATRAGWRIRTHVGLSHAMVIAATDGADCTVRDRRCVEEVIGDYIDGPTWAGILRQRFSKGGIAAAA